ncbi:MAG: hypothetical protein CSYNP_01447 [Syntrophus sp. SKADARSKE-3]|nr:hypothetical protein [Syntrophus sp. SKADARSKE-3]
MNYRFYPSAKEASTIILLRPKSDGVFEILMVKRHPGSSFVPDCYVFPGGAIEDADLHMEDLCTGLDVAGAHRILPSVASADMALGAWIAGIRETFEETGILLAYDRSGHMPSSDWTGRGHHSLSYYRSSILDGRLSFRAFLESQSLTIAADRLHYHSQWITPAGFPIRYDVRFFIAAAPQDQEAIHDGRELTDHVWISPESALSLYHRGRFNMVLPTVSTLRELCRFKTIEEAISEHYEGTDNRSFIG